MSTSKFLFDTRFDSGTPPPLPRKSFTAAEIDAARHAGEESGYARGRAAALREIEARVQLALNVMVDGLRDALDAIHARHEAQGRETLVVTTTILRKLYPAMTARFEQGELESLLADCLRQLASEPRIVVRVADELVDAFKPRIDRATQRTGYPGRVILIGDPEMSDAQSRVEWADGGVERDPARVMSEIDAVLQRRLAGPPTTDIQTLPTETQHGQ